jgi:hypothetical protein
LCNHDVGDRGRQYAGDVAQGFHDEQGVPAGCLVDCRWVNRVIGRQATRQGGDGVPSSRRPT